MGEEVAYTPYLRAHVIIIKMETQVLIHADLIEGGARDQIKLMASSPAFHGLIAIMPDTHVGKGAVIGFTGKFTDVIIPNVIGVDIGCFDKDTEFLTEKGWKKISKYKKGDKVLQYDKRTNTANFVKPINYIVEDCEEFYHFKNSKGLDQVLSEEHKMLIFKGHKAKGYKTVDMNPIDLWNKSLGKSYYGFKTSFDINGEGISLTDEEIKLDVMISADGCIRKNKNGTSRIELHFKRDRKITRARRLLEKADIKYDATVGKDGSIFIYFQNTKFNKSLSKYWSASKPQLKILADESLLWDGHKGYRSFFSSTKKENADVIQFAFSSNNIRAGISVVKSEKKNHKDCYIVTPTKNNIVGYDNNISRIKSLDGKKYCFTVPSQYLVMRRNGKIFVTGNCGVSAYPLGQVDIEFETLDKQIRRDIPLGMNHRTRPSRYIKAFVDEWLVNKFEKVRDKISYKKNIELQLGTLGGGNHFIEIAEDENKDRWLLIHSGSRNFGLSIANFYQSKANKICEAMKISTPNGLQYLPYAMGGKEYLEDMKGADGFAKANRRIMTKYILEYLNIKYDEKQMIESVHNYIGEDKIIRKGAIEAYEGQKVIIPMNMSEGSIIGIGKGNSKYNFSAPHGAGRVHSRSAMKEQLRSGVITMEDFKKSMEGVYSTSIHEKTIDESKFAYKQFSDIENHLKETVDIQLRLKPIYNLKA